MTHTKQPWVHSAVVDGAFLLAPAWLASACALALMATGHGALEVAPWTWFVLVVGVDVAHVYATLFRTYLDRDERRRLSGWLVAAPLGTWVLGVLLHEASAAAFWTALAYAAVFHFVRQQYGFLMLYARGERRLPPACGHIDRLAVYGATLFPLLYWHTHLPRAFTWFVEGDFLALPAGLWTWLAPAYAALAGTYAAKELWLLRHGYAFNLPRNLVVAGTFLSWYVSIVAAQGDLAFTLVNVVSHGVPYIALTAIYGGRQEAQQAALQAGQDAGQDAVPQAGQAPVAPAARAATPYAALLQPATRWFTQGRLPFALGLLLALAFAEEGLWDGLVWREHLGWFPGFALLPAVDGRSALALLVPLLAMPQMTHYVLDGVIWRLRAQPRWRATLFWHPGPVA